MTTSYVIVACPSKDRWFDLDAERTAFLHPDANEHNGKRGGPTYGTKGPNLDRGDLGAGNFHSTHDGAPPLDCWIDGDPWTLNDVGEPDPMSRCLFHVGDVFEKMAEIPDDSVDCLITSPPFLALRSYLPADHPDKHLEIGSEVTPAAYLSTLLALTREWRRILAPHGSICVELGDTYSGSGGAGGDYDPGGMRLDQPKFRQDKYERVVAEGFVDPDGRAVPRGVRNLNHKVQGGGPGWPLPKSLCGIPTLYAWSLAYGHNLLNPDDRIDPWRIRNLIVWHRPNPPVGALGDKVRPSTSYITVACTSDKRWFDLDAERTAYSDSYTRKVEAGERQPYRQLRPDDGSVMTANPAGAPPLDCWIDGDVWTIPTANDVVRGDIGDKRRHTMDGGPLGPYTAEMAAAGAPPLDAWFENDLDGDVWTIPTAPYKGAHYATYPPALPRRLIRLMCPRQVCTVCGEPRRRITSTEQIGATPNGDAVAKGRKVESPVHAMRTEAQVTTLGWTDCGHNNYRRGHVLDTFAGSGTTLAAAAEQGRDATGIDLDPRNLDLARQRIGLFLEETA